MSAKRDRERERWASLKEILAAFVRFQQEHEVERPNGHKERRTTLFEVSFVAAGVLLVIAIAWSHT